MKLPKWFSREKRAASELGWEGWFNGASSNSGRIVTADSAMKVATVFGCVRLISELFASLPLITYKRLDPSGKTRAPDHPLYKLLHTKPNSFQTSFQFFEQAMIQILLRGNFYAQILSANDGYAAQLIPLNPDCVDITMARDGSLSYLYRKPGAEPLTLQQEQVLHVPGLCTQGIKGISPIDMARETIGLALSAEEHGARFFGNGAKPLGILKYPGKLTAESRKRLRDGFENAHSGNANSSRTAVIEEGLDYMPVSMNNEQSQFLESRKFQVIEICRWFRVPPHLIGELERATFSNIEHQSLEFVTYTMRPWLIRWEQAIQNTLFAVDEGEYYAEFLVDAILRGDIKTRYDSYAVARNNGWLNSDEIRERENMNPIPDGKGQTYWQPLNMTELGTEPDTSKSTQDAPVAADDTEPGATETDSLEAFKPIAEELIRRCLVKRAKVLINAVKKGSLASQIADIIAKDSEDLRGSLNTLVVSICSDRGMDQLAETRAKVALTTWIDSIDIDFRNYFLAFTGHVAEEEIVAQKSELAIRLLSNVKDTIAVSKPEHKVEQVPTARVAASFGKDSAVILKGNTRSEEVSTTTLPINLTVELQKPPAQKRAFVFGYNKKGERTCEEVVQ